MSIGRLTSVLGPFFTDADWSQDFRFYVGSTSTEQSWSGVQGTISFVRQGLPRARFTLSSAAGSLVVLSNGLGIRLPASETAKRLPGTYDFELRRIEGDGDTIALLVGQVTIAAGLSASSPAVPVGAVSGAAGGTVQAVISDGAVAATLAPAGPTGASAKEAAIAAGAIPAGSTDADFTAYLREPAVTAASDAAAATAAAQAVVDQEAATLADIEAKRVETLGYRDAADDHKLAAQAAASAVVTDKYTRIGSRFDAEGFEFPAAVQALATSGYLLPGDGGHALYKRVAAQPAHAACLRSADRYLPNGAVDAVNGGWWEITDLELNARALGAKGDPGNNSVDDTVPLQSLLDAMIVTGKPGFIPGGLFRITQPLRVNTTGDIDKAVIGFHLRGAGQGGVQGAWPGNTAGTRIAYAGAATVAAPADALIKIEPGFTRTIAFRDLSLAGLVPTITSSGLTNIYEFPVTNGIMFSSTHFSVVNIERLTFYRVKRAVGVYQGGLGSNGEHISIANCYGTELGGVFYCDHQQAYYHHIRDSSFVCVPNSRMIELDDPGYAGIGFSAANLNGGFYPADEYAENVLLWCESGSTVNWVGGRIEGVSKLAYNDQSAPGAALTINMIGVEVTILGSTAECKLVEAIGNENGVKMMFKGCAFNVSTETQRDLVVYAPLLRGDIKFEECLFINVRNVIPHKGPNYLGQIEFQNCQLAGRPGAAGFGGMARFSRKVGGHTSLPQEYHSRNAAISTGKRENYLLESTFGLTATSPNNNVNYVPPAPWVVTGNGGVIPLVRHWTDGFAEQPWNSSVVLELAAGQKLEQSIPGITVNAATVLRYRALTKFLQVSGATTEAQPLRIALVSDADPTKVYAEERYLVSSGTPHPMPVELNRVMTDPQASPRFVIENLSTGTIRLTIFWQYLSRSGWPTAYAPTAAAAVAGTVDWGAIVHNAQVLERLQLPYKRDHFGTNTTLAELQPGEVYLSQNDDRLAMYANGKWKRSPVFDAKSGAPASGSYALGEVTFNTSPAAAGKAAWICVSAGSPGIHKPWGAIDA